MSRPSITVVSQQRWRAEELATVADVEIDLGLDTRAAEHPGVLWCPGAWAAAAQIRHPDLRLSSAGSAWLALLHEYLRGRPVWNTTAGQLLKDLPAGLGRHWPEPVFAKLPETKHELFEAQLRYRGQLAADAARLPVDEQLQLQAPVRFDYEVRCWVLRGQVVARSAYFPGVAREDWPGLVDAARDRDAAGWLQQALERTSDAPSAFVVDVGWHVDPHGRRDPRWRVVEANAAWSSDWYGADDLGAVVDTIAASQGAVAPRWRWHPSPLLVKTSAAVARR